MDEFSPARNAKGDFLVPHGGPATASVANFPTTQPVSGTVTANQGASSAIGLSGAWPVRITDSVNGPVTVTAASALKVDGSAVTQPVSGTFWQTTQPVSGTFWQATQPVSGTFWQATQPVSGTVAATESGTWTVQPGNTQNTTAWLQQQIGSRLDSANLCVTATGLAAAAVTLTVPAVAAQFHYIAFIQVVKFATAALTAAATPVLVTTTNLPGNPVLSFSAAASAQGTDEVQTIQPATPIKSTAVNTATTIVCPATTATIWRVNVWYYAAV